MKKLLLFQALAFFFFTFSIWNFAFAQEFAHFSITEANKGTGKFANGCLPDFTWEAIGTLSQSTQILNDEEFVDGNEFENRFGQANNAENLRIQIYPNGAETAGTSILSKARLILNFDKNTPPEAWGFCVVDIDVEHCLISAIDKFGNKVENNVINTWLVDLFDADPVSDGMNIPKWDSIHAALLGSDTEANYVVYDSLVIGGMPSSEAPAAFFMPNVSLKSLIIDFENLQQNYFTSFHFYIVSDDDKTFIPDNNFEQALIDLGFDNGPLNNLVLTANITDVSGLQVTGKSISDLTGIEDFGALTDLRCSTNDLSELDVSKNSELEILKVDFNKLSELDIGNNTRLWSCSVSDNQLSEIDVSNNSALKNLYCSNNPLKKLNLTNNPKLAILYCENNNLTELDLSNNAVLDYLSFNENQLSSIDLSQNKVLRTLHASGNQFSELNVDLNTALIEIKCFNNQLKTLDLSNNLLLKNLYCQNNQISNLDLKNNTALYYLNCSYNNLDLINLTFNTDLRYANCSGNKLDSIKLLENEFFSYLDCSSNQLTSLNLLNNTGLDYLDCSNNQLRELSLSGVPTLHVLYCDTNKIVSLDLSQNDTLYVVDCRQNQLTEINLKNGKNHLLTGETTPLYPMYFNPNPMFNATNNPNLYCIQVDNAEASAAYTDWFKDTTAEYSENCTQSAADQILMTGELKIFPNPTLGTFSIKYSMFKAENATLEVFDINGKRQFIKKIAAGTKNQEIDISNLKNGIYFCRITMNNGSETKKLIIQK